MPTQPTRSDLHVNRPLTNISIAYRQADTAFISDKVFPSVAVQKVSDRYFVYTKDAWFRSDAAPRGAATESVGTGFSIDNTPTYFCTRWALHMDLDDDERVNQDDPLDIEMDATQFITRQLLIRREKLFLSSYMTTGIWQGYYSSGSPIDFSPSVNGAGYWDSASSNPMQDIEYIAMQIESRTGYRPNTLVITPNVLAALKQNPVVIDRFKYTQRGIMTEDLLAAVLGVERLFVARAVFNSAVEGQTGNFGFMASNMFLLCYSAPAPALRQPSAGYVFEWTGRYGAESLGTRVKKFRIEPRNSDRIEVEMAFQYAQTGKDLGCLGVSVTQH